jgi:hypothetical protein
MSSVDAAFASCYPLKTRFEEFDQCPQFRTSERCFLSGILDPEAGHFDSPLCPALATQSNIPRLSRRSASRPGDPVPTENSVPINQHPCGTLSEDLVNALFLLASTSQSKDWKSLPRPVVECIQVLGVCVAKASGFDQQKFGRVGQGEAAFPLRKANVYATCLLRLSGASLISVV